MSKIRKDVSVLLSLFWLVLILVLCGVFMLILPDGMSTKILFFVAEYGHQFGIGVALLFAIFMGFQIFKTVKHKENRKVNILTLVALPLTMYGCAAFLFSPHYSRCDYYSQELNGGIKDFQGEKFKVNLCGTRTHHGRWFGDDFDEVRLEIFNEKGDLLAARHFAVDWGTNFNKKIEYHPDHVTYFDESRQDDFEKTIDIPPTAIDWVRARIPLLD